MALKYFGTDGIRGRANGLITANLALRVGQATGLTFNHGERRKRVVIGKDTRLSSYMIETALLAGFTSVGFDVLLVGPMPTPAVGMLTRSMRADVGVMISASHNAYHDNGIKLFDVPVRAVSAWMVSTMRLMLFFDGRVRRLQASRRNRAGNRKTD